MKQRSFNIMGNVAVVNFKEDLRVRDKKEFAKEILERHPNIKTVLEKRGKFKGRLRKMETKHLAGEKTKEVLYRENGCTFRFNVDNTYFSSRLSNERREIADEVKKNDEVLVMFAGVGPYSVVIAKKLKDLKGKGKVYSNEINRKANKYVKMNVERNKLRDWIEVLSGDIKKAVRKLASKNKVFDVIVMPRPQLKDSFLEQAFSVSKKGTRIYYYGFCGVEDKDKIVQMIKDEASDLGRKIKVLGVKEAGEIAPYRVRVRVDFKVMN